jgi:hypothetical protein
MIRFFIDHVSIKLLKKQNNSPHLTINRRDSLFSSKKSQICNSTITIMPKYHTKGDMPESPIRKLVPYSKLQKKEIKYIT